MTYPIVGLGLVDVVNVDENDLEASDISETISALDPLKPPPPLLFPIRVVLSFVVDTVCSDAFCRRSLLNIEKGSQLRGRLADKPDDRLMQRRPCFLAFSHIFAQSIAHSITFTSKLHMYFFV